MKIGSYLDIFASSENIKVKSKSISRLISKILRDETTDSEVGLKQKLLDKVADIEKELDEIKRILS